MNIVAAVLAGIVGTVIISLIMALAPRTGMPKMAIWEMLSSMFAPQGSTSLGWVLHFMMGILFAIVYAVFWAAGIGSVSAASGALFGVVQWLIVGLMMGAMPMMHAGIRAGTAPAPGVYMLKNDGLMAFMGGLVGHVIYGVVVAVVYAALAS